LCPLRTLWHGYTLYDGGNVTGGFYPSLGGTAPLLAVSNMLFRCVTYDAGAVTNIGGSTGSTLTRLPIILESDPPRSVDFFGAFTYSRTEFSITSVSASDLFGNSVPTIVSGNVWTVSIDDNTGPVIVTVTP
jgi:hypothetical protein